MQSYVKMGQLHAPRGLYVYGSATDADGKPNPEPQGVLPFAFQILGLTFWFWLFCRDHDRHETATREETHRPQAQSPPPIRSARGKPQTWGTRCVGFFLHLAHNIPDTRTYRYQKAGADSPPQTLNSLIMSNIQEYNKACVKDVQKYIDNCNEKADNSAQRLRTMSNLIGDEQRFEDGVCTIADVQRMTKVCIKKTATELQNLVREMAEQLEFVGAEAERMERLYNMARKDYREMRMQHAVLGTELDDLKVEHAKTKSMLDEAMHIAAQIGAKAQ